jgi:hypothetical protein
MLAPMASRRSRAGVNPGERSSAVLESVLGQPLKSSNLSATLEDEAVAPGENEATGVWF